MTYEKPIPRPAVRGKGRENFGRAERARQSPQVVLTAVKQAQEETSAIARHLSGGAPSTLAHAQAILDPLAVTAKEIDELAALTTKTASALGRTKLKPQKGDIGIAFKQDEGPLATYRNDEDGEKMTFYPDFFAGSRDDQVYTIIHEGVHAVTNGSDLDIYSWTRLYSVLRDHPMQLRNPDSVAFFVRMMHRTMKDPMLARSMSAAGVELGQEPVKVDDVDPRLAASERHFVAFALAVAEAKLLVCKDYTAPREVGAARQRQGGREKGVDLRSAESLLHEELHALTSAVLDRFFQQPLTVRVDEGHPLSQAARALASVHMLTIPKGWLPGRLGGGGGFAAPNLLSVHELADRLIGRLLHRIPSDSEVGTIDAKRIEETIRWTNIYFSKDTRGQREVIPLHLPVFPSAIQSPGGGSKRRGLK
ncbi:hypothetical protein [Nannocystis pusilla]|uniref:hypothetical protein n=1 Tax=Nannocystis pusilla TaxID=889268 RepID=UPI003DA552C0